MADGFFHDEHEYNKELGPNSSERIKNPRLFPDVYGEKLNFYN
jgi:hypothetical protein